MIPVSQTHSRMGPRVAADPDVSQIRLEHANLKDCAAHLEASLGSFAAGRARAAEQPRVHALLGDFRLCLFDHLASEEARGVLERAAEAEPRFARRVDALRSEHEGLRAGANALLAAVDDLSWPELHARFLAFRRELRDHESAENDVVFAAYLQDIGGRG